MQTFQRAFGVFVNIFGFLVDIVIWVGVVIGPFLLIGWGIWSAIKRLHRQTDHEDTQADEVDN
jgi:hypothetical protein